MDFDSIRIKLNELKESLSKIKDALKYTEKNSEIKKLEEETLRDGFWEDTQKSSKILSKIKILKSSVQKVDEIEKELSDAIGYFELSEELNDLESFKQAEKLANILEERLEKLNIDTLLIGLRCYIECIQNGVQNQILKLKF